jgi:hypothetical protein
MIGRASVLLASVTPSSKSNTTQSAPDAAAFWILCKSLPGTYKKAFRERIVPPENVTIRL